jgi:hypothetical protein
MRLHPGALVFVVGMTVFAWGDDPPTSPCDPGGSCAFASTPTPFDPTVTFGTAEVHAAVGSRLPMQPLSQARARMGGPGAAGGVLPLRNWALTPLYSSNQGTTGPGTPGPDAFDCTGVLPWPGPPNEFDAATVQGLYQDDMWDPGMQASQFAPRTIFMVGASNAGVAQLQTGVGLTYPPVPDIDPIMYRHSKYAVGAVNHGVQLVGGTYWDSLQALGAANFGWLAFDSLTSDTLTQLPHYGFCTISGDTFAMRLHGRATGSENHGYVARRAATASEARLTSGVDARAMPFKEDDRWETVVAIGMVEGTLAMAHLDNARGAGEVSCFFLPDTDPLRSPGYLAAAVGVDAYVTADIPGSFVNVGQARGVRIQTNINELYLSNPPDPALPGCDNWRCDGLIRDLAQLEVLPVVDSTDYSTCPNGPADRLRIPQSVGLSLADPVPNSGGGNPMTAAAVLDGSMTASAPDPAAFASLVARGTTILGDGQANPALTGYDTDVVHVRDVLHLAPRTAPPMLDPNLDAADRAGLVYFDLTRGTLRVSVPSGPDGAIVWMDVALDASAVDPARDHVPAAGGAVATAAALTQGRDDQRTAARDGQSSFAPPRVQALPLAETFAADSRGELALTLVVSGFRRGMPNVYWRRQQPGLGKRAEFGPWLPLPAGALVADADAALPGVRTATLSLSVEPTHSGTVQLMVIEPETGRTAGTAFHLDRAPGA